MFVCEEESREKENEGCNAFTSFGELIEREVSKEYFVEEWEELEI